MRKFCFTAVLLFSALFLFNIAKAQGIEPRGPAIETNNSSVNFNSVKEVSKAASPLPGEITADSGKLILVSLKDQDLRYFEGTKLIDEFKISSGLPGTPTPPGEYGVLAKKPVVDYKGVNYDFKNTKWNLMFKKNSPLNYYIHGAYWHNNFGHPMSHGCINVSYANMEPLYNWADVGTKIVIE